MNYEKAKLYALHRLETELPSTLYYHGVHHTRDDVVPAAVRLAEAYNIRGDEWVMLMTAAWFHDIGFIERYTENEPLAVQIAAKALPNFGYHLHHIQIISNLIMATRLPQNPATLLEKIMVDADLDSLGREDFLKVANDLRREEEEWKGRVMSDDEWYMFEMRFLSQHRYFTQVQRLNRNSGKVRNFLEVYKRLNKPKARL